MVFHNLSKASTSRCHYLWHVNEIPTKLKIFQNIEYFQNHYITYLLYQIIKFLTAIPSSTNHHFFHVPFLLLLTFGNFCTHVSLEKSKDILKGLDKSGRRPLFNEIPEDYEMSRSRFEGTTGLWLVSLQ